MNGIRHLMTAVAAALLLTLVGPTGCAPADDSEAGPAQASQVGAESRWSYQDWPTGPYRVVEDWPKPLPDTDHSHAGWTWGSFGGVYAETPDRIWIAMRGELPLPEGADPWTPSGGTNLVGNATGNGDDGLAIDVQFDVCIQLRCVWIGQLTIS